MIETLRKKPLSDHVRPAGPAAKLLGRALRKRKPPPEQRISVQKGYKKHFLGF